MRNLRRKSRCIHCRGIIGWTGIQWIHWDNGISACYPVTIAEPDISENRKMYGKGAELDKPSI